MAFLKVDDTLMYFCNAEDATDILRDVIAHSRCEYLRNNKISIRSKITLKIIRGFSKLIHAAYFMNKTMPL